MWQIILLSISPISELRGGIPLGIALGYSPLLVFTIAVCANALIFFPIRWMLEIIGKQLEKISFVSKSRDRGRKMVNKYGLIGLVILVGIPLPLTGVYTATLASWSLKYSYKQSFLAIVIGVVIAGTVVTLLTVGADSLIGAING